MRTICAVDPGITGSLVLIERGIPVQFFDMPTTKEGSKNVIDLIEISDILNISNVVVIEQVGSSPRMGVSSAFNFGGSFMGVRGVAAGLSIDCHTIGPQKWKAYHGLLKKPKDAARLKVIEMFPNLKSRFKYKNSVDTCDAILLGLAWRALNVNT